MALDVTSMKPVDMASQATAATRVLNTPELVLEIFSHLHDHKSKACFMLLGRCTWRVGVAENWIEDWQLRALFPPDVEIRGRVPVAVKKEEDVSLSRKIGKGEWDRIRLHLQYLRRIHTRGMYDSLDNLGRDTGMLLTWSFLWKLSTYNGTELLLPALRHVSISLIWPSALLACRMLLVPQLQSVSIQADLCGLPEGIMSTTLWMHLDSFLDVLAENCTYLENLEVDLYCTNDDGTFTATLDTRLLSLLGRL
ncbi:hypothetical protein DACRYDRAFT_106317 [Dacryopinax primogenitus]|uniref:Uncharacterized protein n=1 Tax=Dacryopinax primogenitus (strain DJM 731) TaxID=1858805 RepID=M5G372_DACPD|nr:uncharacterized protein DACRYDRAFT_106317 [Dacryopinax primogenitus]EJU03144.1 hypothetical protein DACRYDRAFT_106317 [Dacryopinax primogenitus]